MNFEESNLVDRLLPLFRRTPHAFNKELGFLEALSNITCETVLVYKISLQPPWGYRVVVSPVDEIVVEDDANVSKMARFVVETNGQYDYFSKLYFDLDDRTASVVCNMLCDEEPSDEELLLSLRDPAELLLDFEDDLRAIASGDFSPLNENE